MLFKIRAARGGGWRDAMPGAKPKARLDALPGFATPQRARQPPPRRVRAKTGA
jgi:hypothetical protein